MNNVYFDNASTTKPSERIINLYSNYASNLYANTMSVHSFGQKNLYDLELVSARLCKLLNINNYNIVYTYNATEANNIGLQGYLKSYTRGKILTTKLEHASVLKTLESFKNIFEIVYINILNNGDIDLDDFKKHLDNEVILVCIMMVHNVVGVKFSLEEIKKLIQPYKKIRLFSDSVQCFLKYKEDYSMLDMFTISFHKVHCLKGVGVLAYKKGINLKNILFGATNQYGLRPGTFDFPLVKATIDECEILYNEIETTNNYVNDLMVVLKKGLKSLNVSLIGDNNNSYIISFYTKHKGEVLVHMLEKYNIYISTVSACNSTSSYDEGLYAILKNKELTTQVVRVSLSNLNTLKEIEYFLDCLGKSI